MPTKSVRVYVEHPKSHLSHIAMNMGAVEAICKCSGNQYTFPQKSDALDFIWRIRNMPTRYVEIDKSLVKSLAAYSYNKGFSKDITGLVSKVIG